MTCAVSAPGSTEAARGEPLPIGSLPRPRENDTVKGGADRSRNRDPCGPDAETRTVGSGEHTSEPATLQEKRGQTRSKKREEKGTDQRGRKRRERRDPEVEIEGADGRHKGRATENYGRGRYGRRLDSSSRERTGAGIEILADLTQRRGPLAPGSTRVSPPRFRRSVAKPGMGFRDRGKGAGGGRRREKPRAQHSEHG
ncbi:hypothetical protein NDU88_003814 [Pleurodeles waltl]|uniref:Uncharacterized protein n=1 Tax=Pleurodeles waltl TaxID=8319 RepID=A0AAV7UFD3_PLEWA|nr:hypothetical protein NDU88_003814 [Pleurodeles waltl]